jgi:MFS transporter, PAT family, beta-lactamase induction signal transducer AmpG
MNETCLPTPLTTPQLLTLSLLGLMSGFTLMLTGSTLNYWLSQEGISLPTIGAFSLILLPYSINFLYAPLFDIVTLGRLGHYLGPRMAWIGMIQLLLILTVLLLSLLSPSHNLLLLAGVGFLIACFSAAQDTLLGALKTELLASSLQGPAAGIYIFGYRIGMLLSGSAAIYLSATVSWHSIYQGCAWIILLLAALLWVALGWLSPLQRSNPLTPRDPSPSIAETDAPITLRQHANQFIQAVLQPVGSASTIGLILLFLVLYRLPDNFIGTMINPFLLAHGYGSLEIAGVGKFFGISSAIVGGFIASWLMKKKSLHTSLLLFGSLHAFAHCLFIVHIVYSKKLVLLFITIGFESVTGGMVMAAYIAFIASLCSGRFRATQYAFFTSIMGLSRAILPALSGYLVQQFGWSAFFTGMTLLTLPSLLLLRAIAGRLPQGSR